MTLARDNETKVLVPKQSTSSSEGQTNHNNHKNAGKQNHTPLVSPVLLANTNITDGSLSTLNKWNGKISQALRTSLIQKNALHSASGINESKNADNALGSEQSVPLQGKEVENISYIEDVNLKDTSPPESFEEENFFENEPRLTLLVGSSSQETISNSAFLTAKTIQEQLEKRVPFRRAVKVALRRGSTPKGIKIQVSGRLNGAEIARSEWIRQGRVPLHTLRAQVDYCSHEARTQYGILGIKVWIFQGYK
ncbi:30S ribosomal protein S3, partial [bacterium]